MILCVCTVRHVDLKIHGQALTCDSADAHILHTAQTGCNQKLGNLQIGGCAPPGDIDFWDLPNMILPKSAKIMKIALSFRTRFLQYPCHSVLPPVHFAKICQN